MEESRKIILAVILICLIVPSALFLSFFYGFREQLKGETGDQGPQGLQGSLGPPGIGKIPTHEWRDTSIRFQDPDGSWGKWIDLQGEIGESVVGPPGSEGLIGPQGERYSIGDKWQKLKKWDLNDLQGKKAKSFQTHYDMAKVEWSISSSYKTPKLIITIHKCTKDGKLINPAYVVIKGNALEKSGKEWLFGAGYWSISIYVLRVQYLEIEVLQLRER